ncbi:paraben-hydrolyzing esterase precursor [Lophiotrema nucula]|uniref:Carboxylic ester hydrolase n=1 Tax=Lophiotrema nucula TaxID=690887 RepID=A0A6A5YU84_9PLEO|nr:paraben-hydrolyzing esterase precursor [Lophiotrema nucula]
MEKRSEPYLRNLDFRGFVEGLTYLDPKSLQPLCHYFGGIPYALPPVGPFRFQKPRPLAACFRYGTRANPGRYTGGCGICPQPRDDPPPSVWEEDCLQSNIWIPVGEPPEGGWPVLFWIHGGFLQFGDANGSDLRLMLSETNCKVIVVEPAYRLNIFGFLASPELLDSSADFDNNAGFWDQRLALEWTWQNISYFGGNPSNITVGGYSAGSHSAFHQLAYDLGVPDEKSIVKRSIMLSNGPGMQPKSLDEAQVQFEELLQVLDIPLQAPPEEKLAKLRATDSDTLIKAIDGMKYHQFRGVTSGFVRHGLHREIDNGTFARQMKRRGIELIIGECSDEHFVYGTHRPPNSYESLFQRLQADYPLTACELLVKEYYPNKKLPSNCKTWEDAWGRIYADIQIHQLERGMVNALVRYGAGDLVHRYRIEWRVQACDEHWPKEWGVTHGTDMAIWFWGDGDRISKKEKIVIKRAFNANLAKFLKGEKMDWGTEKPLDLRVLKGDTTVAIEEDGRLANGVRIWELLKSVGATGSPSSSSKL